MPPSGTPEETAGADDPLIGWRTDALAFEALIGAGAMGAVYRGRQLRLDRPVAIKVIAPHLASKRAYVERFDREARTLAKLAHPNVVICHDFGPCAGPDGRQLLILVMELVDGRPLRPQTMPARAVLELFRQAAEGLAAAHALGVVHRDIKPDNIMVTRSGVAKLADFGLAKANDSSGLTMAGTIMGTPSYMAPEVCQGREPIAASDVYSLGCALFQSLAGDVPYRAASALEAIQCHITAPVPKLAERAPALADLDELLAPMLAKDPAKRPNAALLARVLATWRDRVPEDLLAGGEAGAQAELATMDVPVSQLARADLATADVEAQPRRLDAITVETALPDAESARSLKSVEVDTGDANATHATALPGQARAQAAPERGVREVDLGLDAPPKRFVTPATVRAAAPAPEAASERKAEPVEKKGFVVPDYLKPNDEVALPPPPSAAAPVSFAPSQPEPSAPKPADAPKPGEAAKPTPEQEKQQRLERQAQAQDQRGQIREAASAQRVAECKEHETQGDAHAAAQRWAEAIAAYERAAKAAPNEVARRMLLGKAEALRARARSKQRLALGVVAALLVLVGGGVAAIALRSHPSTATGADPSGQAARNPPSSMPPASPAGEAYLMDRLLEIERMESDPKVDLITVRDEAMKLLPVAGGLTVRVRAAIERVQADAGKLETALADIAAAETKDPARALDLTQRLRASGERLGHYAAKLPLPGRVHVLGTDPSAVRLTVEGVELPPDPSLPFCRHVGANTSVEVAAPGRITAKLLVAADEPDAKIAEKVVDATLADQPLWTLKAELPWAMLAPRGDAVLAAGPHGVALIGADGKERAHVDLARLAGAKATWLPPADLGGADLHLACEDGSAWVVQARADGFGEPRLAHRGLPALAFGEHALVFHLGKTACFAVERDQKERRLIAACGDETLWSQPFTGKQTPWLAVGDETLTVVDDSTLCVLDQEGKPQQALALGGARTGPVVAIDGGRLLAYATASGVRILSANGGSWGPAAAAVLTDSRDALLAADGPALLLAMRGDVELLRWTGKDCALWTIELAEHRRAISVGLSAASACVADDEGGLHVLAAADGKELRTVTLPSPPTGPAAIAASTIIVPLADGFAAYRLAP
jgi:serine/threonine-protein kinase